MYNKFRYTGSWRLGFMRQNHRMVLDSEHSKEFIDFTGGFFFQKLLRVVKMLRSSRMIPQKLRFWFY